MKNLLLIFLLVFLFSCKNETNKVVINDKVVVDKKKNTIVKVNPKIIGDFQKRYPIQFVKTDPDSTRIDFKIDSIDVNKSLWIKNIQLISGTIKNNKSGIYLIVKENTGKILYQSKGQEDSWHYSPTIFKSKKNDRIIIISEIGAEESWGIEIQEFYNGRYKEIGSIDIVTLNEYEESLNIIPFIKVQELNNDVLKFYFDKKIKVFDNKTKKTFLGKNLSYEYKNGKIMITK